MQYGAFSIVFMIAPYCFAQVDNTPPFRTVSTTTSNVPKTVQIKYSCKFYNEWTPQRHPSPTYPGSTARWSPPVLVAHGGNFTLWKEGINAGQSLGIFAERGEVASLLQSLKSRDNVKYAMGKPTVGDALIVSNGDTDQTIPDVIMPAGSTYLTGVRRMAPSPDWFTGLASFNTVNVTTGTWYYNFSVRTFPWDAGTEEGYYYNVYNKDTSYSSGQKVQQFKADGYTTAFVSYDDNDTPRILSVARWDCSIVHGLATPYQS